jgi:hypothetical protein
MVWPQSTSGLRVDALTVRPGGVLLKTLKLIFTIVCFVGSGSQGIYALIYHKNAGWLAGFIFASTGDQLAAMIKKKEPLLVERSQPQLYPYAE